jgi:heme O synthase-like polyprenyltransferase
MKNLKLYAILCRVPVAFFVACSAVTGFFLASPRPDWAAAATAAGIFFLACGASALNQ